MKRRFFAVLLAWSVAFRASSEELVVVSPHWEGYKREFAWAFESWYRERYGSEMHVRWQDVGGASDILKYILSRNAQKLPSGIDVFFGGGVDVFNDLKSKSMLARIDLAPELLSAVPQTVQGNPVWDASHYWYSVNLAGFGISYNKKLLDFLRIAPPERWEDLGAPSLRGWVGSADPRKSGSVRFIYELLLQYYGWDAGWKKIYAIVSNVRSFSSNSSQTPKDIALGEIAAGMMIDSYARDVIRNAGEENAGLVVPQEIPSVFGDGAAVLIDAPHRDAAHAFMEFVLSERAQDLLIKKVGTAGGPRQFELGRFPVRPDRYRADSQHLTLPNPFIKEGSFRYDSEKASKRWRYVTALLGSVAVDLQPELTQARYENGMVIESLPAPITEAELEAEVRSESNPVSLGLRVRSDFTKKYLPQRSDYIARLTVFLALGLLGIVSIRKLKRRDRRT